MSGDRLLLDLFEAVKEGRISAEEALRRHAEAQFDADIVHRADLLRATRNGFPEVVYAEGKRPSDLVEIVADLSRVDGRILVTRANAEQAAALLAAGPELELDLEWYERARVLRSPPEARKDGRSIAVLAAGTTDLPVAEEAALTAEMFGIRVRRLYDVGVAGLHRLLSQRKSLAEAELIIVVAGMEGALPSVVGGLVSGPVIAVPTSVGYGASLGGIAALLGMLSSCAPGVVVVNIDNGFGAGFAAGRWMAGRPDAVPETETRDTDRSKDAR